MAGKRMFAKTIIDSDLFLDMPVTAQLLYFHLCMRADDDGFINNPKRIMRDVRCSDDDMKMLIVKDYVIPFESGVIVIKHWRLHNYIQRDRYKPSLCDEKNLLTTNKNKVYERLYTDCIQIDNKMDTDCIQIGDKMDTDCVQNGDTDKNRLDKSREDKIRLDKSREDEGKMSDSIGQKCPMDSNKGEENKTCSPELAEALAAFAEHRKKLKKPMTDYAKKLLLNKLKKLAKTEQEQIAILNQSIENGWQGVFPLGGERKQQSYNRPTAADMAEQAKELLRKRGTDNDGTGTGNDNGNADSRPAWVSFQ